MSDAMRVPAYLDDIWGVRFRQLKTIIGIEMRLTLCTKRAIIVLGLTLIPVFFVGVLSLLENDQGMPFTGDIEKARRIFSFIYSTFILGAVIFLGSAAIFTALFRSDMLNRSAHYYLLTPVRRELLALGKFLAGLISAFLVFTSTTVFCFLLMYFPYGIDQLVTDLTSGLAAQQLLNYVGVTLLACLGYGSLFTATGLMFRNPLLPVLFISGWEVIHFILPPVLKMFSVVHYLKGLVPIPVDEGPLAIIVAPPTVLESILGILFLSVVALAVAITYLSRMEIRYVDD
jgi:hypothetical protein